MKKIKVYRLLKNLIDRSLCKLSSSFWNEILEVLPYVRFKKDNIVIDGCTQT